MQCMRVSVHMSTHVCSVCVQRVFVRVFSIAYWKYRKSNLSVANQYRVPKRYNFLSRRYRYLIIFLKLLTGISPSRMAFKEPFTQFKISSLVH